MSYHPYRFHSIIELKKIAHEKQNYFSDLKAISDALSEREITPEILSLQKDVLEQMKKLESEDREKNKLPDEVLGRDPENPDWFRWPTTNAPMGEGGMTAHWYEDGLFSYVGYHVGNEGEPTRIRKQILDCIFHNDLPQVNTPEYMREFGTPKSPQRLRKMADVVATHARNLKRKTSADCRLAIANYEDDLVYLYNEYYVGKFHFDWPAIENKHREVISI